MKFFYRKQLWDHPFFRNIFHNLSFGISVTTSYINSSSMQCTQCAHAARIAWDSPEKVPSSPTAPHSPSRGGSISLFQFHTRILTISHKNLKPTGAGVKISNKGSNHGNFKNNQNYHENPRTELSSCSIVTYFWMSSITHV